MITSSDVALRHIFGTFMAYSTRLDMYHDRREFFFWCSDFFSSLTLAQCSCEKVGIFDDHFFDFGNFFPFPFSIVSEIIT